VGVFLGERDDGWFGRDDIATAVPKVMMEEGKKLALNARRLHEVVVGGDGGRQERYVDELVECLRRHSRTECTTALRLCNGITLWINKN
jgi:hypothetical protein